MNLSDACVLALLQALDIGSVLRKLGAFGLLIVSLTDGSLIPAPGAADALTILLSARKHEWWFYYAAAATAGSACSGLFTYLFAYKHGPSVLEKRLGQARTRQISWLFARWKAFAVAIPAMLPVPVSPFLLTAGAVHYSKKQFLAALICGRMVKFTLLAGLAALFGRRVLSDAIDRYQALVFCSVVGIVVASSAILYRFTASPNDSDTSIQSNRKPIVFLETDQRS